LQGLPNREAFAAGLRYLQKKSQAQAKAGVAARVGIAMRTKDGAHSFFVFNFLILIFNLKYATDNRG